MARFGMNMDKMRRMVHLLGVSLLMVSGLLAAFTVSATGQGAISGNVIKTTCSLYATVHTVIFVVGLVLIIIGAALYAGAQVLPGNLKGSAQGYGMGMAVGGIVGVLLALAAPFILQSVTGNSTATATCAAYSSL